MSYVQEFISENISSYPRLVGTEVEGYPLLTHKKKGDLGELIVGTKMKEFGYSVTPSDIYNGTWDKRIDGVETEIKLSVGAKKDDTFIINHVKRDIKWERFIFYGYNIIKPHRLSGVLKKIWNSVGKKPIGGRTRVVQKNESLVVQMS